MSRPSCVLRLLVVVLAISVATLSLAAQSSSPQEPGPRQQAMVRLAEQWQTTLEEIARGGDPARLQELQQKAVATADEFASLATGFDVRSISGAGDTQYDLQTELMRLLRPLVRALSRATESPRRVQELRDHLDAVDARLQQAKLVQRGFERAAAEPGLAVTSPAVRDGLRRGRERWDRIVGDLENDRIVTSGQLDALRAAATPVTEAVQSAVERFFEQRGMSLLLAGVVALGVLLALRLVHRAAMRTFGQQRLRLPVRILDVALQLFAVAAAALSVLLVFYLRGDFELLALALVFLIGLGWALSRTVPLFVEQLRILVNAGAVREGERIVVDGLPYLVEALRLHSRLVNPLLQGGVLRVPLKDLVGKSSRPFAAGESWFPCRQGDWVRLADGSTARVELQSPEQVVLLADGAQRTLRTADFLGQSPANLSAGSQFAVTFGIDYGQQAVSTSDVPRRMQAALERGLPAVEGGQFVERVRVEFAQAGASSLDLEARVFCRGEAAPFLGPLRRATARILVDACTENGWPIPFPQLTVHRAN